MKILLESRAFHPSIGGLEMMAQELARKWEEWGHEVRVVTVTELGQHSELPDLSIVRKPGPTGWTEATRWADVFFQNGVSLKSLPYPLLFGRPIVFRHPDLLTSNTGGLDVRNELKRWATRLGCNVASCRAVADTVSGPTEVVPNTFRSVFDGGGEPDENRDGLLVVGRLVSFKGIDVAINALQVLRSQGVDQTLTVCGDGPDRHALENKARQLGVENAVEFKGWTSPERLAEHYSHAEVALVPSRYEPFGIVALEAIASGCPVVASRVDGLPEAVGDCGLLVTPEDPEALADGVVQALESETRKALRDAMPEHVDRHRTDHIAKEYLEIIEGVVHAKG